MALDAALREQVLDLLERDAHFREEVRRHLLTAELVELPERFAAFAARVDRFMDTQQAVNARVDRFMDTQQAVNARVDEFMDTQQAVNARVDEFIVEQQTINARVTDDLGILKGHAAGRAVRDQAETLPDLLRLAHVATLARRDLVELLAPAASGIAAGDRQSFYRADLVVEARDADGAIHYVAVEASYTADRRDSDRVLHNAGYLTRCTGRPAHAVVASLRNDRDVQALVDAGTIHWHRLTGKDLDPD